MHRSALPLLTSLTLLAVAAPAADASHATARLAECDRATRTATFQSDMQARPGVDRMQVRFVLLRRESGRWSALRAPGLGAWRTSDRGVGRYVYTKAVENLPAPGAYRARVVFRWLDAEGQVLERRRRRTRPCRLPDPRPNLRVTEIEARAGGFAVTVRNAGRSAAGPFAVGLGGELREVGGLAARAETEVLFDVLCRWQLVATVDPDGRVDERDEGDNRLVRPCPPI